MPNKDVALYWINRTEPGPRTLDVVFVRGHLDPEEFVGRAKAATHDMAETLHDAAALASLSADDVQHGWGRWLYQHEGKGEHLVLPALPDGGPPQVADHDWLTFEVTDSAAAAEAFPITSVDVSYDAVPVIH